MFVARERLAIPAIQYHISQVRQLYYQSNNSPYLVPELELNLCYEYRCPIFDYRLIFTTLLDEGCKLDLSNYPDVLLDSIHADNLTDCQKLITAYPEGYQVKIPLSCNPTIMKLMRAKFNVESTLEPFDLTDNIESTMNIVTNFTQPVHIIIRDYSSYSGSQLLFTYLKFLKRSFTFDIKPLFSDDGYDCDCEQLRINTSMCYDNLNHLTEDCAERVLERLINEGRYLRAKELLNTHPSLHPLLTLTTPNAYSILFRLLEDYPDLVRRKKATFVRFLNRDHDLEYCIQFEKYWKLLGDGDIKMISNPRALMILKERGMIMPTCNQIIESSMESDWMGDVNDINKTQLRLCLSMIPHSEPITDSNIRRLIARLEPTSGDIMILLIKFHEANLIKLDDYRGIHPYIDFLIPTVLG